MTTIRPNSLPVPAAPSRGDVARQAAQRAFFEAAVGKTTATQSVAPHAVAAPAQPAATAPVKAAEQPSKILRPGSLLDIRI